MRTDSALWEAMDWGDSNARLVAAAPDLLAALLTIIKDSVQTDEHHVD